MIGINKKYKTRNGHNVINLQYVERNSEGNKITFPIKGTLLVKKENKIKKVYHIWTVDGKSSVVKDSNLDLILVK